MQVLHDTRDGNTKISFAMLAILKKDHVLETFALMENLAKDFALKTIFLKFCA
jgi:hypothetical protein